MEITRGLIPAVLYWKIGSFYCRFVLCAKFGFCNSKVKKMSQFPVLQLHYSIVQLSISVINHLPALKTSVQSQQIPVARHIFLSYCLDYTGPNNVSVFMCCVVLPTFPCNQQRFLSFQEFHVGLTSGPTSICLRLHHRAYFAEMFTSGTYNN